MQRRLRARDVVGHTDARAERLFANQQFVVVVTNADIEREVLEQGKAILYVRAQSSARFLSAEEEWVGYIEIVYRVRKSISSTSFRPILLPSFLSSTATVTPS